MLNFLHCMSFAFDLDLRNGRALSTLTQKIMVEYDVTCHQGCVWPTRRSCSIRTTQGDEEWFRGLSSTDLSSADPAIIFCPHLWAVVEKDH